jgi:hypothetical protein
MARGRNLPASTEEKVAKKISKELSDFTLDLEAIGWYLAKALPYVMFSRALTILESAQHHKEQMEKEKTNGHNWNNF